MKKIIILCLLLPFLAQSQNPLIQKKIKQIEIDKQDPVQSVFEWVATNVKYDVKKLKKIIKTGKQSSSQTVDERINDVLKSKRGVCQHYSELFAALMNELGYETKVITGFTNKTNIAGENTSLGHAWNAVKVEGVWKLYDATWAAGGVRNGKKFIENYNDVWYDVHPKEMIKTHIPFDPMWQLLEKPLSYDRFLNFQFATDYPATLDYNEMIDQHFTKTEIEQYEDALNRSKTLGKGNALLEQWAQMIKTNVAIKKKNEDVYAHNEKVTARNEQINILNKGVSLMKSVSELFNQYIKVKNKQFKDKHWTESRLKNTMEKLQKQSKEALSIYSSIQTDDVQLKAMVNERIKHSSQTLKRINSEAQFINQKFK